MPITLKIAGVDRTTFLQVNSVRTTDHLHGRNQLTCQLVDPAGTYRPGRDEELLLIDTDGTTRIFGGTIDVVVEEILTGSDALAFDLTAVSFEQVTDRHLVARVYENQTLAQIVTDIVTNDLAGEGITTGGVETGPTITKVVFNYQTVARCFDELTELTGYAHWIDDNKVLNFRARESLTAPFSITSATPNCRSIRIRRPREDYRNQQFVRAGTDLTSSRTESLPGDGTSRAFLLEFPAGKAPTSITVTGTPNLGARTIGIRGVETGFDFYWNKGDRTITQDDGGTVLVAAQTLNVTYQGQFPIIVSARDDQGIADRAAAGGGSGVYEDIEDDPNIDDDEVALDQATALLGRFKLKTYLDIETDTAGLRAGQLLTVNVTEHGLNGTYLVESVEATDLDGKQLRYRATVLDGDPVGGWLAFFRSLVQAGRVFVIRENEVLLLLRTFSEQVSAAETLTSPSAAPESRVDVATVDFAEVV